MLSRLAQQKNSLTGCSKRPFSKAAASEGRTPLGPFTRCDELANEALWRPDGEAASSVEGPNDARTKHGKRRVLARRGWAGEKDDFFSSLQSCQSLK